MIDDKLKRFKEAEARVKQQALANDELLGLPKKDYSIEEALERLIIFIDESTQKK